MRKRLLALIPVLSVVSLLMIDQACLGQVVPFRASGENAIYSPASGETSGPGKATHMGRVFGSGVAAPGVDLGNGLFEWSATNYSLQAANGDEIFMEGGGLVQFIPIQGSLFFAVWTGDFNVTGGTGRFSSVKAAAEPIQVTAINNPFTFPPAEEDIWTYSWSLDGQIDLGNKGKKDK